MIKKRLFIVLFGMVIGLAGCGGSEELQETDSIELNIQSKAEEEEWEENVIQEEDSSLNMETDVMADGPEDMGESWENMEQDWNSEEALDNPDEWPGTVYNIEEYGTVEEYKQQFFGDTLEEERFYYAIDRFYLNENFLYTMNDTLQNFYDEYEKKYMEYAEEYNTEAVLYDVDYPNTPYSYLHLSGIQYVDNDYVSILFDDMTYMGGAFAYPWIDTITIDRHTGKEVTAMDIMEESEEKILDIITDLMELDKKATWKDVDFYLEDGWIVFYYRIPNSYEKVKLGRIM